MTVRKSLHRSWRNQKTLMPREKRGRENPKGNKEIWESSTFISSRITVQKKRESVRTELWSRASQETSNIPFPWFLVLGYNRQAQERIKGGWLLMVNAVTRRCPRVPTSSGLLLMERKLFTLAWGSVGNLTAAVWIISSQRTAFKVIAFYGQSWDWNLPERLSGLFIQRKRKVDRVTANHYLSLTASQERFSLSIS